jgi:membrane protein YqaA with SNARE-associated domain
MSVKTKLARQAVMTTAKHTAHGTASRFTRKPLRSITLLALGATLGGIAGWLIGRSGGSDGYPEPLAGTGPTSSQFGDNNNPTEHASETGVVS